MPYPLDERRHMFNPTNIAIVIGLVLIPRHYFEVRPDDFSQNIYPILHVLFFGMFAVWFGKTWTVTLSYFSTCLILSIFLSTVTGDTAIYFIGPEIGALGLIFMFLMITDPKTTPSSRTGQYVFGASVAVLLYVFRSLEIFYAHYFALFIVTLGRGVYETFFASRVREMHWQ